MPTPVRFRISPMLENEFEWAKPLRREGLSRVRGVVNVCSARCFIAEFRHLMFTSRRGAHVARSECQMSGMQNGLPPPSAELVICRVGIETLLEVLGPEVGERWLSLMADRLVSEERLSEVIKIRPAQDEAAVCAARREAISWFRECMPLFVSKLQ